MALSVLLFQSSSNAQTGTCAKFKIGHESFDVSEGAAAECKKLVGTFDLSQCRDSKPTKPVQIVCKNEMAFAYVQTQSAKYEVKINRVVGSKGNVLWDSSEVVKQIPILSTKVSANARPISSSPSRGPASVIDRDEAKQSAEAQSVVTSAPPPTKTPLNLTFSGLFDVYYEENFNRPSSVDAPTANNPALPVQQNKLHNYDLYHNQVGLNLAEFSVKNTGKETTLLVDFDFGQQADYMARSTNGTTDEVSKNIGQAVLTYTPESAPRLTASVGKMYSNMGYETPKAINNWQYSRSFLFTQGLPVWHVGASLSYAVVPDFVTATGYVYNGWNTIYNSNSAQNYAAQVTLTPNKAVSLTYNGIIGPEQAADTSSRNVQIHEVIATWNASAKSQFALDAIYGAAGHSTTGSSGAEWWASSLAYKFQVSSLYSISPRAEFFRDAEGFATGSAQDLTSLTLTQAMKLKDGLEPRLELRWDHSTAPSFGSLPEGSKNQASLILGIIYGF